MKQIIFSIFIIAVVISCRTKGPIQTRAPHNLRFDGDWFSLQFHACESEFTPDEAWTQGTYFPYDTVSTTNGDSLVISFDFVADCCLTFSGRAEVKQDTLLLKYGLDRVYAEACGCWCEYGLVYRIDKRDKNWTAIKILHMENEIFKSASDE